MWFLHSSLYPGQKSTGALVQRAKAVTGNSPELAAKINAGGVTASEIYKTLIYSVRNVTSAKRQPKIYKNGAYFLFLVLSQ